ncbi:hypothetical protein NS359_16165 [Curtobacterium oceanosedimentum]|uniref:Carbohydrate kinase PfkB domain-containing protein n=1 Tax=Curtobacterium oceanosedimentum TaxID=465820 RepID=A0A147DLJ3_9MICO|nr:hypothetical protein NS359_16165 [Curtobacterium oceanosedimentum]
MGACDSFVAAWLAATITGADPDTALDRAADAGALACTVPGDWRLPAPGAVPEAEADPAPAPDTTAAVHDRVDR